ncbi:MAG: DUF86 domain-containing protein [Lachnospiraceae bacterium]|nr:DUF86 domain-containing protein [Lachnospiraceae bacterium]
MKNETVISKMQMYVQKIFAYVEGMDYEEFIKNDVIVEACVFNLSQLGEIANKADVEFQNMHKEIPWRQVYGLRNRIVHDYEGVNLKLVWEIISDDLPMLKTALAEIKDAWETL